MSVLFACFTVARGRERREELRLNIATQVGTKREVAFSSWKAPSGDNRTMSH